MDLIILVVVIAVAILFVFVVAGVLVAKFYRLVEQGKALIVNRMKADPEVTMGAVLRRRHLNGTFALVGFPLDVIETARDPRLVEWKPRRLGIAILQVPEGDRPMTNIVVVLARR